MYKQKTYQQDETRKRSSGVSHLRLWARSGGGPAACRLNNSCPVLARVLVLFWSFKIRGYETSSCFSENTSPYTTCTTKRHGGGLQAFFWAPYCFGVVKVRNSQSLVLNMELSMCLIDRVFRSPQSIQSPGIPPASFYADTERKLPCRKCRDRIDNEVFFHLIGIISNSIRKFRHDIQQILIRAGHRHTCSMY